MPLPCSKESLALKKHGESCGESSASTDSRKEQRFSVLILSSTPHYEKKHKTSRRYILLFHTTCTELPSVCSEKCCKCSVNALWHVWLKHAFWNIEDERPERWEREHAKYITSSFFLGWHYQLPSPTSIPNKNSMQNLLQTGSPNEIFTYNGPQPVESSNFPLASRIYGFDLIGSCWFFLYISIWVWVKTLYPWWTSQKWI